MKKCSGCKILLKLDRFSKDSRLKSGLRAKCKSCIKVSAKVYRDNNKNRQKSYYEKNKEDMLNYGKLYREINKEDISKKRKIYRNLNKDNISEKAKVYGKVYRRLNLDKFREYSAKRHALKLRAIPKWANRDRISMIYKKAKWLESLTGLKYHVDHIIPLQGKNVCGLHIWENLQILEASLNEEKSNKMY